MKILLDENIPIQLKRDLPENYEWFTRLNLLIITIKAKDNKIEILQKAIPEIMKLLTPKMKGIFEVNIYKPTSK